MNPAAPALPQTPGAGQAPLSPDKLQLLELPTWEEVEALLQNPIVREFRLDIETDSTIRMDEEQEKASRMELLKAVAEYMQQAMQAGAQAPEIVPMLAELLMYGIRAFTTARSVEQTFEDMMHALEEAAKQPKPPDPEMMKEQARAQTDLQIADGKAKIELQSRQQQMQMEAAQKQREMQSEAERAKAEDQSQAQLEQWKAQLKMVMDQRLEEMRLQFEAQKVQFEAAHKERLQGMQHQHDRSMGVQQQMHERQTQGAQQMGQERLARKGNARPRA